MVNKKARNKFQELDFDLPPSALAKTYNLSSTKTRKRKGRPGKSWEAEDDTPKAFARLMRGGGGGGAHGGGLDNGNTKKGNKKRKTQRERDGTDESGGGAALREAREGLKINPGESLREFGRRVDAAIPVHFPRGDGREPRAKKKQKQKKKKAGGKGEGESGGEGGDSNVEPEEGSEVHSDDDDEQKEQMQLAREGFDMARRRKGKGRRRGDSPDPWAELEKKRGAVRFGEVAPPPPALTRPRALLYMGGSGAGVDVDGVPKSAGSLAKREELAGERRSIVEAYRKMMGAKRGGEGRL